MQNTLLGLSPTMLALVMVALTGGGLLIVVGMAVSNPLLVRMGLRNTVRRPTQTVIMVAGLTLSAVFITASFGLQDSFAASAVTSRLAQVGWVDEAVSGTFTQSQVRRALARLRHVSEVQAATGISMQQQAIVRSNVTSSNLTEYGVPSDFDQVYGPVIDSSGHQIHFSGMQADEVILSHTGGLLLELQAGDTLQVKNGSNFVTRRVYAVLSNDLVVTTGELSGNLSFAEIIMPLSSLQQLYAQEFHHPLLPNIICVKNVGSGGLDDAGAGGSRSQAVLHILQQIFGVTPIDPSIPHSTHFPTDFDTVLIHPLKPTVVEDTGGPPIISNKGELIGSPAARQFFLLLPVFTCLLVGAGMLLLVLLVLLLAAERRAELGMSRAIGLQRRDLVLSLLIEASGYGVIAALLGVPLGVGAIALELVALSHLPTVGLQLGGVQSEQVALTLSLTWQSGLLALSLTVLTTTLVVLVSGMWISRMNIVAAIRDLNEASPACTSLVSFLREFWMPPRDAVGQIVPETSERRATRKIEALGQFIWGLCLRGPLLLFAGVGLLLVFRVSAQNWMQMAGVLLLIAGGGLLLNWLLPFAKVPSALVRRLSSSAIGLGWLISGIQMGMAGFTAAFAPNASASGGGYISPSLLENVLSTFSPLLGMVLLVMSNVDLLVDLLTLCMRHLRSLAPISRISLVFPLMYRTRMLVTVSLLSLITFLVMLVVTNNLSIVQQSQVEITTGNFQLALDIDPQSNPVLEQQVLATPRTMSQDVAGVVQLISLYNFQQSRFTPIQLHLPGNPRYPGPGPTIVSDSFLSLTTMPMFARAQGFATDQAVWDAVRDHPGYAVVQYQGGIGLSTHDGFAPFTADIFTGTSAHSIAHRVTVIGVVPNNTNWTTLFLSNRTATAIGLPHTGYPLTYCFRLQSGASIAQARHDIGDALQIGEHNLSLNVLGTADQNAYTQTLTYFLASYLVLGLVFGAFSIGVITSRAVVERRQQIGVLRAIGFSRGLVRSAFLLESSFVITVSLAMGTVLAWWLVSQVTDQFSRALPLPVGAILVLLLGSYLVVLICTVVPTRHASRISPAEALRYE